MTDIQYEEGRTLRLTASGHAGAGSRGGDPVCAAVSALLYMIPAVLEEEGQLYGLETGEGFFHLTAEEEGREVISHALCMLKLIARRYPENLRVSLGEGEKEA